MKLSSIAIGAAFTLTVAGCGGSDDHTDSLAASGALTAALDTTTPEATTSATAENTVTSVMVGDETGGALANTSPLPTLSFGDAALSAGSDADTSLADGTQATTAAAAATPTPSTTAATPGTTAPATAAPATAAPTTAAPTTAAPTTAAPTTAAPTTVAAPVTVNNNCSDANSLVLKGNTVPGNTGLGLATSPETPRNPCGDAEERSCFNTANAERTQRGLAPYLWDGDLADLGRSHSADMNQRNYFQHGSSTTNDHLYQQRGDFLGLKNGKFSSVVENIASGSNTGADTVAQFMASGGHRAVILGEGYWGSITHMACGRDGNRWSMEFGW